MKIQYFVHIYTFLLIPSNCEWRFELEDYASLKLSKHFTMSTKIGDQKNLEKLTKQLKDGLHFNINVNNRFKYKIFIKKKTDKLINRQTEFYVVENNISRLASEYATKLLEGFVINEKYTSYVIGYLEEIYFYGKIQIPDKIYYVENLKKYTDIFPEYSNSDKNAIVFERAYLFEESGYLQKMENQPIQVTLNSSSRNVFKRMANGGKMCSLLVLLDNSFLKIVHNMNIDYATQQVLMSINEANSLFRSTDFNEDGYPDNIGFYIKYFFVFQTPDNYHLIPTYSKIAMDGRLYMKLFSRLNLLSEVCLGVAFTGQSFKYDIIGISYSAVPESKAVLFPFGGICDRPDLNPYGLSLNTLAVSGRSRNGQSIPQFIFELSLCHELGHSFGADHDTTKKCDGYLMTSHTPLDQNRKHFIFSNCSKKDIIRTIIQKGQCFENDETPYCGNKLKEYGEECDCGTIRDCQATDACCTPPGRPNACKIKREMGYHCHPSQGLCCTIHCKYANLMPLGLDCTNFEKSCPCTKGEKSCHCGINSRCNGQTCSSKECTRIGLEECPCPYISNATDCRTCCFSRHNSFENCSFANEMTTLQIALDKTLIKKLKPIERDSAFKNTQFGFYENFCNDLECVGLYFRQVKTNGFCVLFGKLGDCKENNTCVVHDELLTYNGIAGKIQGRSLGAYRSNNCFVIVIAIYIFRYIAMNIIF